MIPALIAAGATIASGLMGASASKKAAKAAADAEKARQEKALAMYNQARAEYQPGMMSVSDQYKQLGDVAKTAYTFNPVTARNEMSETFYDPATGEVTSMLNPKYAGWSDRYQGAADTLMTQLGNFDPNTFAKNWYDTQQGLLTPTRENQAEQMAQLMFSKGALGASNSIAGQGGNWSVNPFVSALGERWAQQDKQLAADAENMGQVRLDQLIGRQAGMFGRMGAVDALSNSSDAQAMAWTNALQNQGNLGINQWLNLQNTGIGALANMYNNLFTGGINAASVIGGMPQPSAAAASGTINAGAWNAAGNALSKLPWGNLFSAPTGAGGAYGAGMTYNPSANNMGMLGIPDTFGYGIGA